MHDEHPFCIVIINRITRFAVHSLWHQNTVMVTIGGVVVTLCFECTGDKNLIEELLQ